MHEILFSILWWSGNLACSSAQQVLPIKHGCNIDIFNGIMCTICTVSDLRIYKSGHVSSPPGSTKA